MRKIAPLILLLLLGGLAAWFVLRAQPGGPGGLTEETPAAGPESAAGDGAVTELEAAKVAQPSADRPEVNPVAAGEGLPTDRTIDPASVQGAAPTDISVVDGVTGRLIPGAEVFVAPSEGAVKPPVREQRAGVTDAAGRFDPSRWQAIALTLSKSGVTGYHLTVLAVVPGYGTSGWERVPEVGATGVVLRVVPGGIIEGVVRDQESRRPVAGAEVEVQVWRDARWRSVRAETAVTDAAGRYRFAGLPPQRALRTVLQASSRVEPLEPFRNNRINARTALDAGTAVLFGGPGERGQLDLDGHGHLGVQVTFELRAAAGTELPESVLMTHGFTFDRPADEERAGSSVTMISSAARSTIVYRDGRAVTTRERDTNVLVDPADPIVTRFLPAGHNHVAFHTETLASELWSGEVPAGGAGFRVVRVLRPKPALWVQLVDAAGAPRKLEGVTIDVTAYQVREDGQETGASLGYVETDASGRAEVTRVLRPVGGGGAGTRVKLGFRPEGKGVYGGDGWADSDSDARVLEGAELAALLRGVPGQDGAPAVITVPALPSRPVTFRVVDARGRALSGVEVRAKPVSRFRAATARADSAGLVTFDYVGEPVEEGFDAAAEEAKGTERQRPVNAFGVPLGDDHWDDPVFSVDHNGLRGRLPLDEVSQRESISEEEYREQLRDLEAELAAFERDATPGDQDDEEHRRELARDRVSLEAEADAYARLAATGVRDLILVCVDGDGQPWSGASVEVWSDSDFQTEADDERPRTTAAGRVRVRAPLDATRLNVRGRAEAGDWLYPAHVMLADDTAEYRVVLRRQRKSAIEVRWPAGSDAEQLMRRTRWLVRDAASGQVLGNAGVRGASGERSIWLPQMRVRLEGQTTDGVYRGAAEIDVKAGGTVVLDMAQVAELTAVRLLVLDRQGRPAAGGIHAWASLQGRIFRWDGALRDDGTFAFPLVPGRYDLLYVQRQAANHVEVATLRDVTVPSATPITLQLGKR